MKLSVKNLPEEVKDLIRAIRSHVAETGRLRLDLPGKWKAIEGDKDLNREAKTRKLGELRDQSLKAERDLYATIQTLKAPAIQATESVIRNRDAGGAAKGIDWPSLEKGERQIAKLLVSVSDQMLAQRAGQMVDRALVSDAANGSAGLKVGEVFGQLGDPQLRHAFVEEASQRLAMEGTAAQRATLKEAVDADVVARLTTDEREARDLVNEVVGTIDLIDGVHTEVGSDHFAASGRSITFDVLTGETDGKPNVDPLILEPTAN